MDQNQWLEAIVRDLERVAPYTYEGLYEKFVTAYMNTEFFEWSEELARVLGQSNHDWEHLCHEIAGVLWDRFERRISC